MQLIKECKYILYIIHCHAHKLMRVSNAQPPIFICSILLSFIQKTSTREIVKIKRDRKKKHGKYRLHCNYWKLGDISISQQHNKYPLGGLIYKTKILSLHGIIFTSDFILVMTNGSTLLI